MSDTQNYPAELAFSAALAYAHQHAEDKSPHDFALAIADIYTMIYELVTDAQPKTKQAAEPEGPLVAKESTRPKHSEATPVSAAEPAAPEKPKEARIADSPTTASTSDATPAADVTYEQVAQAFLAAAKKDRASALRVLNSFGASRAPELKKEQWAAFIAEVSK